MVSPLLPELLSLKSGQNPNSVADPDVDIADEVASAIAASELRCRVATLPLREREVISSRYGIGRAAQSHRAIAKDLDLAVGTICAIEQRALTMLRALYMPDDGLLKSAA